MNDVKHRKRAENWGGFWKKVFSLSWELDTEREWSTFGARWGQTNLRATGAARDGRGTDEKARIERMWISLPYVETFNQKVIKGSVPELRSRKCFSCFEIPMFYVHMLWKFYVHFAYPYLAMVLYQSRLQGEEQLLIGIVLERWRLEIALDHLTCYCNNGSQYYRWTISLFCNHWSYVLVY